MPNLPPLPRHRGDAWRGGFVLDRPGYTTSIAAREGTVVAGADRIYRLRPGATQFQARDISEDSGDVACVAVEPRRLPGRPSRFAVATFPRTIDIFDEKGVARVNLPEDHGEILQMMWSTRGVAGDATVCLHVRCANMLLRHVPGGGPMGTFERVDSPSADICAMATDGARRTALATLDDDADTLDVFVLKEVRTAQWSFRKLPVPGSFFGARLAVAGKAVAVSFLHTGGIWLTRDLEADEFVELEGLRSTAPADGTVDFNAEGAVAFEGPETDAALFAAVRDGTHRTSIVRVDADGRQERVAELSVEGDDAPTTRTLVHEMVWDATRRTLWSAAGHAGVLCSTAPGAPVPFGEKGAAEAVS